MKEKHILRITLLAVLLCMMTILCATADELDAKIIRWDGTGNVAIDSIENKPDAFLELTEVDGNLRVTGSSGENYNNDNYFYLKIAKNDYVDIYNYPYYVIKYKINDKMVATGKNVQVYFGITKGETSNLHAYYYDTACSSGSYDLSNMWLTYLFHFSTDQSDVTNKLNGLTDTNYGEDTYLSSVRIGPAKYAEAEAFDGIQMDIEYIGFFKTKVDAENYINRSSVIIRFDGDENRAAVNIAEEANTGTHEITEDGIFKLTMTDTGVTSTNKAVGQPRFTLKDSFSIKSFPYVAIRIKGNGTKTNMPFYSLQFSDGNYLYQSLTSIESDTFNTQRYYAYSMNGNGGKISTDPKETVSAPFIQFKGYNGDVNATAEIEYIAYFRTEGEMQAYDSGIAEKVNAAYKKIANADFAVEANSEDTIKNCIESRIGTLLGADSGVTYTISDVAYTAYDKTATAMVTVSADYGYTGFDGEEHTYTESKKVGLTIDVDYLYDFKVISWNESGNPVVNSAEKTYSLKKTMPANTAYTQYATWQPSFDLGEDAAFALADYPYVSVKFRTNYPSTIQFYAAEDANESSQYRFFYLSGANNADGNWHVAENEFTDVADDITVSVPFFQFKDLAKTPDGDLFAEIDSISFFKSEADAKHYAFEKADESKVIVNGIGLYAAVSSSTSASLNDDGSLRLTTTNNKLESFKIKNVFKGADGNNLDLYEYPYVKIRFKSVYNGNVQAYMYGNDDRYYWYTPLNNNNGTDGEWHEALMSFNYDDGAKYTTTANDDGTWSVGTPDTSQKHIGDLPTESWLVGGYMFHMVKGSADGYLDIDYIAFYKTKEAAMADTTHADDLAIANSDLAIVESKSYSYTLHQAIGEIAIENHVRTTIEKDVTNVSVTANANGFTYGADSCTVKVTLSYGTATVYTNVTVDIDYLSAITLESLGAQIRPIGEDGLKADLRFGAKVEYNADVYSDVAYGMVVSPVVVDNTARKFEKISTAASFGAGSKAYKETAADGTTSNKYFEAKVVEAEKAYDIDGENYKIFTAVVTGIPDGTNGVNAYDTKIVARPYITYKLNGTAYTVYGTEMVRTVNEVLTASGISTEVSKDATWKND